LIPRQDYDQRKADYESASAVVAEAQATLSQLKAQQKQLEAQRASAGRRVEQAQAQLRRVSDVLQKHYAVSPIDGVVTNLPVRVGETVVPGIQNSSASLIMTIADMSLITAEIKVDETDIVNVELGQVADVGIDAEPDKRFAGRVIEIGNTAILRSTGVAASQSNVASQEAKDFKVVVALDNPPAGIRPGMSCTARITTATREKALTVPIQAVTVRMQSDLQEREDASGAQAAIAPGEDREVEGVFAVRDQKVEFVPLRIGVTGASNVEVLEGLEEGAEIVTGSYQVLRTIRPGTKVVVENNLRGT
jgi:HlyD family secretion protein